MENFNISLKSHTLTQFFINVLLVKIAHPMLIVTTLPILAHLATTQVSSFKENVLIHALKVISYYTILTVHHIVTLIVHQLCLVMLIPGLVNLAHTHVSIVLIQLVNVLSLVLVISISLISYAFLNVH